MAQSTVTDWIASIGSVVSAIGAIGAVYMALITLRREIHVRHQDELEEEWRPARQVFVTEPRFVKGRSASGDSIPGESHWIVYITNVGNPVLNVHVAAWLSLDGHQYMVKQGEWLLLGSTSEAETKGWTIEGCSAQEKPIVTVSFTDSQGRRWLRDSTGTSDKVSLEQEQLAEDQRKKHYEQSQQASLIDADIIKLYQQDEDPAEGAYRLLVAISNRSQKEITDCIVRVIPPWVHYPGAQELSIDEPEQWSLHESTIRPGILERDIPVPLTAIENQDVFNRDEYLSRDDKLREILRTLPRERRNISNTGERLDHKVDLFMNNTTPQIIFTDANGLRWLRESYRADGSYRDQESYRNTTRLLPPVDN